jgi:hypothetical protein
VTFPPEEQRDALALLAPYLPEDAYLAGGVAVAAHLGHRISHDLDVFTTDSDPQRILEALADRVEVRVTGRTEGSVYLEVGDVPVSMIRHRYPPLSNAERLPPMPVPVASMADLTAMKLHAIASRGAARDFWDLHELLLKRPISLQQAIEEHGRRYPNEDTGHVVRSLAYFGDAEAAPLPRGLSRERWQAIREDFERWVQDI